MSDTTCPECEAPLREGATFCTGCGHRLAAPGPPPGGDATPADAPGAADATRVDNPGLSDATQTFAPPPSAPPPAPPPAPAQGAPWEPAQGAEGAPPAPAAPPQGGPSWGAPPQQAAPPWQQAQQPPQAPQQPWGQQAYGAPAPAPTSSSKSGSPIGGIVAIVGAILTLVGLFTAWIGSNQSDETITGWALASGDEFLESNDPYIILALGVAALVIGVLLFTGIARIIVRIAAVIIGIAVIGVAARDWLSIVDLAKDFPSDVEVTAQFGFYLTIAGGVVTAVAALMPGSKGSS